MMRHWTATDSSFEVRAMPFYWRLSDSVEGFPDIPTRLPMRVSVSGEFDYVVSRPTADEWAVLEHAYAQDANIGFLNPESGQLGTYGASVNSFIEDVARSFQPSRIFEIGCGAGATIDHLRRTGGWKVVGIDPSAYSKAWSERLGFELINDFFGPGVLDEDADFIYCNDVFEHVPEVTRFAGHVCDALRPGGVFAVATTSSTRSIELGDLSMLEHQHVNMFSDNGIREILTSAGFHEIDVGRGSHGNTFHVVARKAPAGAATRIGTMTASQP